jgi:hypothetical protein
MDTTVPDEWQSASRGDAIRPTQWKGGERDMQDPTRMTRLQRIHLHLRCPWRNWHEVSFHLSGILREFELRHP